MYYEQINDRSNHKEALIVMGFLSEDNRRLACWSSNSNSSPLDTRVNCMLPNRFWVSIKDDMLYICKSNFNGKVLSYYANIELKNIKFIKKINYTFPCFVFEVKNESGVNEFRINPLTTDDEYYAKALVDYINLYRTKVVENNDL